MIDKVTANARKPQQTEYGNAMLERMNNHHNEMALWALDKIDISKATAIVDIGCGGGQNIKNMSQMSNAKIYGIDYSLASVEKSKQVNFEQVENETVEIVQGNVSQLPFEKNSFDIATAFETVYYWDNIVESFKGVYDVLKECGSFLVCNEDSSPEGKDELIDFLKMKIYSAIEIQDFLYKAGFNYVKSYTHENGNWICVVGTK